MCQHLKKLEGTRDAPVRPSSEGCQECLARGDGWVHLRLCMTCGHVGCCDSSPNRHATQHFHGTKHPVVKSFEPGEDWAWCYVDEDLVDSIAAFPVESPPEHYASPSDAR
jgi:thioredoxin reductase (NADPH)